MPDGFKFDIGFGDVDPFLSFGAGAASPVLPDVSRGSQAEQPAYPGAGDGFNWGGIATGLLNYAIYRDQQKMTAVQAAPVQQQQQQMQAARAFDTRILMYAAIAGGVLFLVTRK